MDEKINQTRTKVFILFGTILAFTLGNILYYKIILQTDANQFQQLIRLALTFAIMYLIYIGKNWAKMIFSFFLVLGVLFAIYRIFSSTNSIATVLILVMMIVVYGYTTYFINRSDAFDQFFRYQKKHSDRI